MNTPAKRSDRIGPHGEIYVNEGAVHQTFTREGIVPAERWGGTQAGPQMVATLLRDLADSIEKHATAGFVSDSKMAFPGSPYQPPQLITTPLCHLRLWGTIEEPPRHGHFGEDYIWESYRVTVNAQLGFE